VRELLVISQDTSAYGADLRYRPQKWGSREIPSRFIDLARELGVRFVACTMTMDIMAVSKEELVDGLEYGGVATYMADAARSKVTLFI
jgi:peroxiredoxin family protein